MYLDPPLVDTHAHVFNGSMPFSPTAWRRPDYEFTYQMLVKELDRHGIPFGVIGACSIYDDYSDYTLDALRVEKRLRATMIVDPNIERLLLERLKNEGVTGIRFVWNRLEKLPDLDDKAHRKLLARCADLGLHVQIYLDAARLPPILEQLGGYDLNIAVDHFGDPDTDRGLDCPGFQAVLRSIDRGRTWVRISSPYRMKNPALADTYANKLLETAGPERLMWGTDAPFILYENEITYENEIANLTRWVPDPSVRREISNTALKFYFFS